MPLASSWSLGPDSSSLAAPPRGWAATPSSALAKCAALALLAALLCLALPALAAARARPALLSSALVVALLAAARAAVAALPDALLASLRPAVALGLGAALDAAHAAVCWALCAGAASAALALQRWPAPVVAVALAAFAAVHGALALGAAALAGLVGPHAALDDVPRALMMFEGVASGASFLAFVVLAMADKTHARLALLTGLIPLAKGVLGPSGLALQCALQSPSGVAWARTATLAASEVLPLGVFVAVLLHKAAQRARFSMRLGELTQREAVYVAYTDE
eukprot:m51a1_g12465 hypothetical protein (281) ;mRNA; r:1743-3882